ncbi:ATP-binding protein [Streptomyces mirabilis]|uniref:ATP-binding protein n=1 Tax=Streptomyces mirabilis TaxID=68239 RepID=UPI0033237A51
MPPTTAELVPTLSLGDLVNRCEVVLAGLDAPQRAARDALHDVLDGQVSKELIEDAALVASELIANALQHTPGALLISVDVYEFGAAMGVVDCGRDITAIPDRPANSSTDAATVAAAGRGLFIIDRLATKWSVAPMENGKIVIAVLTLPAGAR